MEDIRNFLRVQTYCWHAEFTPNSVRTTKINVREHIEGAIKNG